MKSVVNKADKKVNSEYPCLMISTESGNVVLFTSEKTGVIVHIGESSRGRYFGENCSDFYMPSFTPFNGTVTLSND